MTSTVGKEKILGTGFDILLIAVILVTVIVYFNRGIFKMIKSFKLMAAFWIALEYKSSQFVRYVIGKFISFEGFRSYLRGRLDAMFGDTLSGASQSESSGELFGGLADMITNISEYYNAAITNGVHDVAETVLDQASAFAEGFFTQAIGFILVFIVVFIALTVICAVLSSILKRGILRRIDKILGGLAGLAFGFVFAWVISLLLVNFLPIITDLSVNSVTGGFLGVVRWFHDSFAFSRLFGIKPLI